jgi:hypothetical protein
MGIFSKDYYTNEEDIKRKILGKWRLSSLDAIARMGRKPPFEYTFEFFNNGNYTHINTENDEQVDGTYEISGNRITYSGVATDTIKLYTYGRLELIYGRNKTAFNRVED